jgi:hypothetical protein
LDSRDLAAVAGEPEPAAARRALLGRALLWARDGERELAPGELPAAAAAALAAELALRDPQCEVEFRLRCAGCGHAWLSLLDVAAFYWAELAVQARRLLGEVRQLAAAYGWREADVLAMSAARRAAYLEQAA